MGISKRKILFSALLFFSITLFVPDTIFAASFETNLRFGDTNSDVILLQQTLNKDSRTEVAQSGPGSVGNETNFFGNLTKSAVIRFQELYASDVLTPAGISSGTGFVGQFTRQKLNTVLTQNTTPAPANTSQTKPTAPISLQKPNNQTYGPLFPDSIPPVTSGASMQNTDYFIDVVKSFGKNGGLTDDQITFLTDKIKADSATHDFPAEFAQNVAAQKNPQTNQAPTSFFARATNSETTKTTNENVFSDFLKLFVPERALAQSALQPYGGTTIFVYPCTCASNVWLMLIFGQLGGLFSVEVGSQLYGSWNLPFASQELGFYIPGTGAACEMYYGYTCAPFPNMGLLSPISGSSGI